MRGSCLSLRNARYYIREEATRILETAGRVVVGQREGKGSGEPRRIAGPDPVSGHTSNTVFIQ